MTICYEHFYHIFSKANTAIQKVIELCTFVVLYSIKFIFQESCF